MRVKNILIREIYDSRAEATIEVILTDKNSVAFAAQIPSGKSRGKSEAKVLPFAEIQKNAVKLLKKEVCGKDFNSVRGLDGFLINLDGTKDKSRLGGNVTLGVSIAFAKALALEKKEEVWKTLRNEFFKSGFPEKNPLIFSNLINGGAHAENNLAIQEYMAVVKTEKSVSESVKKLIQFYKNLGELLKERNGVKRIAIGDEGGYSLDFKNNFEPIQILEAAIFMSQLESEFSVGLDAAAGNFSSGGNYVFDGRRNNTERMAAAYFDYFKKSKLLFSIEDPFQETDFEGFKKIKAESNRLIIGDDLTATNPSLIKKAAKEKLIGGVIIKPNQIGTVTETCEAIKTAKDNGLKTIISHRSGETDDNFIIHLAKASGADGVKIGAPLHERIFKFNELTRIYG